MTQNPLPLEKARWSDFVHLEPRYLRSVNLVRDLHSAGALDGYVPTPLVRTIVERMGEGLKEGGAARAWSITGPYGSGKSAFALFLAHLFGVGSHPATQKARQLLRAADKALYAKLFGRSGDLRGAWGLIPVVAVGERSSLTEVLTLALERTVDSYWSGRGKRPDVVYAVRDCATSIRDGKTIATHAVVELFEDVAETLAASGRGGCGLLVVLDEAGKVLEHAAGDPSEGDVQLLQELAESACRSEKTPIYFGVMLHQAFEHYAGKASRAQKAEWAKVQGRFEDVVFQDPTGDLLRLIGSAFQRKKLPELPALSVDDLLKKAAKTVQLGGGDRGVRVEELLRDTLPLHPYTALAVGQLFRGGFSQNERSLFAFLSSVEPLGFQSFLSDSTRPASERPLFGLDDLYDYLVRTFGGRVLSQHGRGWSRVEEALRRMPDDATPLDQRVLKIVGLLNALGDGVGFTASEEVIQVALGDFTRGSKTRTADALKRLSHASLIVFRKFRGAYQLWEGSDLDVGGLVHAAMQAHDADALSVDRLARVVPPRPIVARRHLFETGTLRFFELRYGDERSLVETATPVSADADGLVWLLFPSSNAHREALIERVSRPGDGTLRPVVYGVVGSSSRVRDLAVEFEAIERVLSQTPALQGDPVARRELQLRRLDAEQRLKTEVSTVLAGAGDVAWFVNGLQDDASGVRGLGQLISGVCEMAYGKAPHIQNELLNRRRISSAAAAARRTLMQAMLSSGNEKNLGITGSPPELGMYRSLLKEHGLHRKDGKHWSFNAARRRKAGSLYAAYEALRSKLQERDGDKIPVNDLYEVLRAPPYGVRDGVLPVILLCLLLEYPESLSLYESSVFLPQMDDADIERLIRAPDKFCVQHFELGNARVALLQALLGKGAMSKAKRGPVLTLVRQLVGFVRKLPEYTLNTRNVSEQTRAVREALFRAKDPSGLIFRDLPLAVGVDPITAEEQESEQKIRTLEQGLRRALRDLASAYPTLLNTFEADLIEAFGLSANPAEARAELGARSERILDRVYDTHLKAFLIRAVDGNAERETWLVSLATLLGSKPPEVWRDRDFEMARVSIRDLARRFGSQEALFLAGEKNPQALDAKFLRVSVGDAQRGDQERVIVLRPAEEAMIRKLRSVLERSLRAEAPGASRQQILAALTTLLQETLMDVDATSGLDLAANDE